MFNSLIVYWLSFFFFEDKVKYGELYEHCYSHDDDGGNEAVDAYLHTCPEEDDVEQEIHPVAATESDEAFP